MDAQEQFSHDGDQGDHLVLMILVDQVGVFSLEGGLSADCDQGGHIKGRSDIAVAGFGDVAMAVEAGAGLAHTRVQAGMGDPLRAFHLRIQNEQFAQKQDGASISDAAHRDEQIKFTLQAGIGLDDLLGRRDEGLHAQLELRDRAEQLLGDDVAGGAVGADGMQAVVFANPFGTELVDAPSDALQGQDGASRSNPRPKGHDLEEAQDAGGVDLVGLASEALGSEEVFDGFGIDDRDLEARGATEHEGDFQTVGSSGLQADANGGATSSAMPGMGDEFFVTDWIIGEGHGLDATSGQNCGSDQFLAADIDAKQMRICFHGDEFLCSLPSGSPTLNPCPPTLLLRLPEWSGPSALSGVWQRGRGAFLTHKLR